MPLPDPYAKIDEDGYELEIVEQTDAANHPFLRDPIPTDEARFSAKPGNIVKLIFRYRESADWDGQPINAEHMWVNITHNGEGCLVGTLDNGPRFTKLISAGDMIHFHPKHIVRFWSNNPGVPATPTACSMEAWGKSASS
jgi:hypothetical protein